MQIWFFDETGDVPRRAGNARAPLARVARVARVAISSPRLNVAIASFRGVRGDAKRHHGPLRCQIGPSAHNGLKSRFVNNHVVCRHHQ